MASTRVRATVSGIGHFAPSRRVTNHDLARIVDTSDEWIRTRTGIIERRVADEQTTTADLAEQAALRALQDAGTDPSEVDFVLVATASADMMFPSTASLVQDRLGARRAAACDISSGCAGFIYGMVMAAQFIENGVYRKVLVIGADTLSKLVDWTDRNTCVLFGDGAGAVLLEPATDGYGLLAFNLRSDGAGGHLLCLPAGGSRMPATHQTVDARLHHIKMVGGEVFKFAVRSIAEATADAVAQANLRMDDIDLFIPHQANARIIDASAKRLGIAPDKVFVNVDYYGNTSCASIPVAMSEAVNQGRLQRGTVVALCGFGAGLSWGASVMHWSHTRSQPRLQERSQELARAN